MESHHEARKLCYLLYFSGFLDFFAVGMIMPLMSTHMRELGASPTLNGVVGSIYGGVQLISSPLMGKVSDNIGRYPSLLLALVMTAMGYSLIWISYSILVFALARFIVGCFKHSQSISKADLYDALPKKEASAAIGRFHSFSSLGFIVGPIIGGHVSEREGGVALAALCAACIFLLNAGLIWWAFPQGKTGQGGAMEKAKKKLEDEPHPQTDTCQSSKNRGSIYNVSKMWTTCRENLSIASIKSSPLIEYWDLFLIRFLASLAIIMYRTNLNMCLREKHGSSKVTIGYLMSYTSTVAAVCGFFVGFITKRYKHNESKLFFHTILLETVIMACLSLSTSIPYIVVFLLPLSFCTSIARVSSTSDLINVSGKQQVAAFLGWNQSIQSFARMAAPTFVGLIQEWNIDGAAYFSFFVMAVTSLIMTIFPHDPESRRKKAKDD